MPNLLNAYPEQNSYYICLQSITHARKRQIASQFICLLVKNSKFHTHHILSEPVTALTSVWSIAIRICNRRDAVSRSTSKTVTYVVTDLLGYLSECYASNYLQYKFPYRTSRWQRCFFSMCTFVKVHIRLGDWKQNPSSPRDCLVHFIYINTRLQYFGYLLVFIRKIIDPNGKARNIYCRPTNMNLTSMLVT
jgi:hypothetical protein